MRSSRTSLRAARGVKFACSPTHGYIQIRAHEHEGIPMIITHHREKLINAIIYFSKRTKNLGKTKLMKLLFFFDFYHFRETGKSATGLDYYAWEMGPVPADVWRELRIGAMREDLRDAVTVAEDEEFQQIRSKAKFDDCHFTGRELRLLKKVSCIFKEATADQMVEVSHLPNEPWHRTIQEKGPSAKIDYLLAIDMKSNLSVEEAKERQNEIAEMHEAFGVL